MMKSMKLHSHKLIVLFLFLCVFGISHVHAAGDLAIGCPDPTIIKSMTDGHYYIVSTGRGIPITRSKDLVHWERIGRIFDKSIPDWANKEVPGARNIWAPDITYFNGSYHVYYSVSTFGSQRSCIGLVTNKVLDPSDPEYKWTDHGKVIESDKGKTSFNAIDAQAFIDKDGSVYLSWGSYWDGIKMSHLDPKTGKVNPSDSRMYDLARHPEGPNRVIEAVFIIYHDEHYYLFASYDTCCDGVDSTYNIRVGRSEKVTGPYVDFDGKRMTDGGGTMVLANHDNWRGPGHNAVLQNPEGDYLVHHTYDANENRGGRNLQIRPLLWTGHGWPLAGEPIVDSLPKKGNPRPADIVGTWKHMVNYTVENKIKLLPDGKINTPDSKSTWTLEGNTLFITQPNADAPTGAWLDECYVAADGRSYIGRNQSGTIIRGIKAD